MRSVFISCIAILSAFLSISAQGITIKKFLGTSEKDLTVVGQLSESEVMKNASSKIPFIRDIEFKIRNRAFEQEQFQYVVQVTPEGFGEGRALKNLFKSQTQLTEQQIEFVTNVALLERYNDVIDFLEDKASLRLDTELVAVLEDKIKVLEKKTFTNDFDFNNLIIAENDLTKTKDASIEAAKEISILTREIRTFLNDTTFSAFDTAGLVNVESVAEKVKLPSVIIDTENVYLNNDRLKLRVSEGKYALERAQQSGRFISSLSFCYNYNRFLNENAKRLDGKTFDMNNAYYVEMGFRLPFITADGRDIAQRKEALLAAQYNYQIALRNLDDKMKHDVEDIGSLIAQFRYLNARENEVDAQASFKKYLQMNGVDPLMLLVIKQGIIENRLRIEKTRYDILRNYIRVLDSTGRLSKRPLVNFLSSSMEAVAP